MEKKYQVFISSTYRDLIHERRQIIEAILELDCIPIGMEHFPAGDDDQWTTIKKIIDNCDYYVLIIGGCYGSENKKGVSYTELEYDYAIEKEIPVISFIHKTPSELPLGNFETSKSKQKKLNRFKEKAKNNKMCRFWDRQDSLTSQVSTSIIRLIQDKPRNGWIKATNEITKESLEVSKYISYFNPRRIEFTSLLDKNIFESKCGDDINILGISQRVTFTDSPGINVLVKKISEGIKFKILLLHPDSLQVTTIQNLSKDYGFADVRKSLLSIIDNSISELYLKLSQVLGSLNGSIEIRFYKDLCSTLSYYSINDRIVLGLYYSHISGTHCPAFELKDEDAKADAKMHFKTLWDKSEDYVALQINKNYSINNLNISNDEKYGFNYFDRGLIKGISNYVCYQWMPSYFIPIVNRILEITKIKKGSNVLDYGCAKGYMVRVLRELGYNSFGCDISFYALSNCDSTVKDFCFQIKEQILPLEVQKTKFEIITFLHVLEHIETDEINKILSELYNHTNSIYIEVPLGDGLKYNNILHENDKTHLHKQPIDWWIKILNHNNYNIVSQNIVNEDYAEIFCIKN